MMIDEKKILELYNALMQWLTASTKQATAEEKWTKQMTFDEDEDGEEPIELNKDADWPDEFREEWG